MGPTRHFSLSKSTLYSLAVLLLGTTVATAAGFWGVNIRMEMRDTDSVALLSNNMAQIVSQQLKRYQYSVSTIAKDDQAYLLLRTQDDLEAQAWAMEQRNHLPQNTGVALIDKHNRVLGDPNNLGITAKTLRRLRDQLTAADSAEPPSHWFAVDPLSLQVIEAVPDVAGGSMGFVFASFELRTLQTLLEQLVGSDQKIVLHDKGEKLFEIGRQDGDQRTVSAVVPVNNSSLKLEMSRPQSDYFIEYLIIGGTIAIMALASIILTLSNLGLVKTTSTELKRVASYLHQLSSGPFATDAPPCTIKETAALLPAIQRMGAELQKKQEAITELGFTDNVTKLPNRLYFHDKFRHAFELAKRGTDICLLVLEIDQFQKANDVLGSEAADDILEMLADSLRQNTRKSDFAARLGTYNFAAIFYNAKGGLMRKRLSQLHQSFLERQKASHATAREAYCGLSGGMTCCDAEYDNRSEDTLVRAESALKIARDAGGNRIELIPPTHEEDAAA